LDFVIKNQNKTNGVKEIEIPQVRADLQRSLAEQKQNRTR